MAQRVVSHLVRSTIFSTELKYHLLKTCSHLSATTLTAYNGLGKHYLVLILQMRSYQRPLDWPLQFNLFIYIWFKVSSQGAMKLCVLLTFVFIDNLPLCLILVCSLLFILCLLKLKSKTRTQLI